MNASKRCSSSIDKQHYEYRFEIFVRILHGSVDDKKTLINILIPFLFSSSPCIFSYIPVFTRVTHETKFELSIATTKSVTRWNRKPCMHPMYAILFSNSDLNSLIILWNVRETAKSRRIWLKSSRTISRDFQARLFVTFDRNYESGRKPVRLNGAYNFIRATRRTRI